MLHIGLGRETQIEQAAVGQLRRTASQGGCGGASSASVTTIQLPAQDWLVQTNPAFAGSGRALLVSNTGPSLAAGIGSAPPGRVAAESVHRSANLSVSGVPPTAAIHHAVVGRVAAPSTPAALLVLGGIGLFAVLALLSAVGRRLAQREQLAMAAGTPVAAAFGTAAAVSAPDPPATYEEHHPAGAAAGASAWAPPVAPGPTDAAEPDAATDEDADAGLVGAAAASSASTTDPAPAASAPPTAPPPAAAPEQATTRAQPAPAVERALSPDQGWLRTHRSQIALALAATAGTALRVAARVRRRR